MSNGKDVEQNNHDSHTEIQAVYREVADALIVTIRDAISVAYTILESEENHKEQQDKIDDLKNMIQLVTNLTGKIKNLNHQYYKSKDIV